MSRPVRIVMFAFAAYWCCQTPTKSHAANLTGKVVDESGNTLAARIYLSNASGEHFHVESVAGTAVPYDIRRGGQSYEVHTTISAEPFHRDLPPGEYSIAVEKGKEYVPATRRFTILADQDVSIEVPLRRWATMAARGWYSGETHVHREVTELPTLQLAEDLNVAFPLTAWVTDSLQTPAQHNKSRSAIPPAQLIRIDDTHVFWPINTEYEIFTIRGQQHTLGALFLLNHQTALTLPAPPVAPIAAAARKQGAFLELDKHNWPWSMMLVPVLNVDLFELANNHMWRTNFLYSDWYPEYVGKYMNVEMVDGKFTERGWIQFGFENYYALLNCGFRMQPTAGTASGVHPVPFGFGRVYVHLDGDFGYQAWVDGLLAGKSFVTTGPMLTVASAKDAQQRINVTGLFETIDEPISLEVLVNGQVVQQILENQQRNSAGVFEQKIDVRVPLTGSSWIAVRGFTQRPGGGVNFAHTAPAYFEFTGKPLRPTHDQRDYLVQRVSQEIERSRHMIPPASLQEFESARDAFAAISPSD